MVDKEIIKALECCTHSKWGDKCAECFYCECDSEKGCQRELIEDTLDLINRQQSAIDVYMQENDRLKTAYIQVSEDRNEIRKETEAEIERLTINMNAFGLGMKQEKERADTIRAEAIKEVLDRVDAFLVGECGGVVEDNPNLDRILFGYNTEEVDAFIENLRKEMVGEDK